MARPKGSKDHHERANARKPIKIRGGWGSLEACQLGGHASLVARNQAAYFARRREAWAARIAEVIGG